MTIIKKFKYSSDIYKFIHIFHNFPINNGLIMKSAWAINHNM